MIKKTIVTLSDSNYFPLLEELIHSIRKFKESESVNICVLDAGLTSEQIEKISSSVDDIKKADYEENILLSKPNDSELKIKDLEKSINVNKEKVKKLEKLINEKNIFR